MNEIEIKQSVEIIQSMCLSFQMGKVNINTLKNNLIMMTLNIHDVPSSEWAKVQDMIKELSNSEGSI